MCTNCTVEQMMVYLLFLGPFLKTLWISIGYIIYWVNFHMSDNSINKKNHCPITTYVIVMEFAWI